MSLLVAGYCLFFAVAVPHLVYGGEPVESGCVAKYSQGVESCNLKEAGYEGFAACLKEARAETASCCKTKGCEKAIFSKPSQGRKTIDDRCFVHYSRAAGQCNEEAEDDDGKFLACLRPVKAALQDCCSVNMGSKECSAT